MKKTWVLTMSLLAIAVLATSCRKDDFELLRHGYRLEGTVSPNYELPLCKGEMNLDEMLKSFGGAADALITSDSVITFYYNCYWLDTFYVGNGYVEKARKTRESKRNASGMGSKEEAPLYVGDTTFTYEVPIDLFSQVEELLREHDLSINHLWVSGDVMSKMTCPEEVRDHIRNHCWAVIDSIVLHYVTYDDVEHEFGLQEGVGVRVDDITADNKLHMENIDMAPIINTLPKSITATCRLRVNVGQGMATSDLTNVTYFDELLDSLQIATMIHGMDLTVELPCEVSIKDLTYSFDLQMKQEGDTPPTSVFDQLDTALNQALGEGNYNIDSSAMEVILRLDNGIPINLLMDATVLDENDEVVLNLMDHQMVASAPTGPTPDEAGLLQATAQTRSELRAQLNLVEAHQFVNAEKVRLKIGLTTNGGMKVRVRRSDFLKVKLLARVNPVIEFEYKLPFFENGVMGQSDTEEH